MSSHLWTVKSHIIPASHIRGFPRGQRSELNPTQHLRLAVKQYIPLSNVSPQLRDFTLVFAHNLGAAKETFEPFFDDLLAVLQTRNSNKRDGEKRRPQLRSIWAADSAQSGASYLLNEGVIGDELHWFDFARDMLFMINLFQTEMPPPLIGMGQSLGNTALMMMSGWHPRLFTGIVAVEAALGPGTGQTFRVPYKFDPAVLTFGRKDNWRSWEEARASLEKSHYHKKFDKRVLEKVMEFELRETGAESKDATVTLTSPKTMEFLTWAHPFPGLDQSPDEPTYEAAMSIPFFQRPEGPEIYGTLPHLTVPILYAWGTKSPVTHEDYRKILLGATGTGISIFGKAVESTPGAGGVAAGQVTEVYVEGAGHAACQEKPAGVAEAVVPWIEERAEAWTQEVQATEKRRVDTTKFHPEIVRRVKLLAKM